MPSFDNVELIPAEDVRADSSSFNVLVFRQLERINYLWSKLFSKAPIERKEGALELFLSIQAAESLMWARLGRDKTYVSKRKEIGIDNPENFRRLAGGDLSSLMLFTDLLDKWYKLITRRLDRFNFFPPVDVYNFTSVTNLKKSLEAE